VLLQPRFRFFSSFSFPSVFILSIFTLTPLSSISRLSAMSVVLNPSLSATASNTHPMSSTIPHISIAPPTYTSEFPPNPNARLVDNQDHSMATIMIIVCAIGFLGFGIGCFRLRRMQRLHPPKKQGTLAIANEPWSESINTDSKEGPFSIPVDQESHDRRGPPPQYTQKIDPSQSHVVIAIAIPSVISPFDSTLPPASSPPSFDSPV